MKSWENEEETAAGRALEALEQDFAGQFAAIRRARAARELEAAVTGGRVVDARERFAGQRASGSPTASPRGLL